MEIENIERIILENDKRPAAAEILRLFEFELATRGLAKDGFHEVQFSCGHPVACIRSTDEGTHHCGWCEELAEARAENERLLNVVRSVEAKADGHYEGRHKAGPDDWLWVRAMCRNVMKEKR